ncbi:uncharacterized protein LOC112555434 [Pomacea canaliculata]|uniref:uncharacterized protein LOC112555434 n=1 Tax=Pomacea canaliculata TaxID=400727 RepID=UPI000D730095|nr:uncharacterized protein LOC112555434 [Pomacea canaliculata]
MRHLLNVYGLRDALLLIGAIMFHVCACAVLFRPLSSYKVTCPAKQRGVSNCTAEVRDETGKTRDKNRQPMGVASRLESTSCQSADLNNAATPQSAGIDGDANERPCSSFELENIANDSMVNLSSLCEAAGPPRRRFDRSSTTSSVRTLGSLKGRSSQSHGSERTGSLKNKSPRATAANQTSSFKRRRFQAMMRASGSLERHPSALWDARQPGSLKMASGASRSKGSSEGSTNGEAIEMSYVKGGKFEAPDSPDRKTGKTFGSFKAVDIVNPIRFIQERKKLLQANNIRYMSEAGDTVLPADHHRSKKTPLKRFYSVETGSRPTVTALPESFLHRRIRQISGAESWGSESSLFASAGDLALASLQNISESATEVDNDDVFSLTSSKAPDACSGFFRLSAQIVYKGETRSTSVPLFDWSLLVNPVFLVFMVSLVCMNFSYPNVFVMLPSYCQEVGMDKNAGAFMVSIIGLADLVGRIFIGWFSDLHLFPRKYSFLVSLAAAGLFCTTLPSIKTWQGLVAFCSCFGFFGGCFIALIAVILVDLLGKERLATSFGLASMAMAVGLLAGPAIYGSIRDTTNSWDMAFVVAGLMSIAAACSMLLEPPAHRCLDKTRSQQSHLKDEIL